MKILDGKKIAEKILSDIFRDLKKTKTRPGLAVVLIGHNEASELYAKIKKEKAKKVGIDFFLFRFKENSSEKKILEKIKSLNEDKKINGIIVQLPLPEKYSVQKIISTISSTKDADGFSKTKNIFEPVFPMAMIKLLESTKQKLDGKKAVVIANSKLFGEVMSKALEKKKIKAEYILKSALSPALSPALSSPRLRIVEAGQRERGIEVMKKIKRADILISAVGSKGIIKGDMVKSGAIVIDGGISKIGKKVFGDADAGSMKNISGFLSPVPGGVGPMTVACLLRNVLAAFENQNKI